MQYRLRCAVLPVADWARMVEAVEMQKEKLEFLFLFEEACICQDGPGLAESVPALHPVQRADTVIGPATLSTAV